jgi:hypothetical protein
VTGVDCVARIFGYIPGSLPPKDFFLSEENERTRRSPRSTPQHGATPPLSSSVCWDRSVRRGLGAISSSVQPEGFADPRLSTIHSLVNAL